MYSHMIQQEQEQQEEEVLEALPEFGEVEGERIKLAGLDYSLLRKETAAEKKEKLMRQIKSKLSDYAHKVPVGVSSGPQLTQDNDQLTKSIMLSGHARPAITQATFYLFPLDPEFAPHLPEVITRRFGRMHAFPLYAHHKPQELKEFRELVELDDKIRRLRREQQKQAKKIVPEFHFNSESDEDDIFAGKSESEKEPGPEKGLDIKVGSKLSFGIAEQDIFGGPRYKQVVREVEEAPKVTDKYDFLRKQRKPNESELGYDQCYVNTGPSLDEMRQLRREGVVLFGDAKEYVQKERKYNINQDYAKIKRIIDEKSKKS